VIHGQIAFQKDSLANVFFNGKMGKKLVDVLNFVLVRNKRRLFVNVKNIVTSFLSFLIEKKKRKKRKVQYLIGI
jgi:hypothetical protein